MSGFQFRLESLVAHRGRQRDLCRQALARTLDQARQLEAERQQVYESRQAQIEDLRNRSRGGDVDIDGLSSRRDYAGRLAAEIEHIDREQARVAEQLDLCRAALCQADQQLKSLEKLREKRLKAYRIADARREVAELDEIRPAMPD